MAGRGGHTGRRCARGALRGGRRWWTCPRPAAPSATPPLHPLSAQPARQRSSRVRSTHTASRRLASQSRPQQQGQHLSLIHI
eukprot:1241883-Rhodomonas_salina.1